MKTSLEGVVWCCSCSPFKRFNPPGAAQKVQEHYDAGKHDRTEYARTEVRVDA